jgi:uncharacterized protein YqhQ
MENRTRTNGRDRIESRDIEEEEQQEESQKKSRRLLIGAIIAGVLILGVIVGVVILLMQPWIATGTLRDIAIILMALVSVLVGIVLFILVVQVGILLNLLQNEIWPILKSTNETLHTIRGTTVFLSDNLVEPVIKLNSYLAAMRPIFQVPRIFRRR